MKITTKVTLCIGLFLLLIIGLYLYELERQTSSPGQEGTIINKGGSVYIVLDSNFETKDLNLPIEELLFKYKDIGRLVIHQSNYRGELKNGQRVKVWINEVEESFPPNYKAIKLEKM